MAKAKATVSELNLQEKEQLNRMLKESTDLFVQMESCKLAVKDIAERAKDELDLPTAEFNRYAKIAFDNQKARDQLDQAEEVYKNCVELGLIEDDYE